MPWLWPGLYVRAGAILSFLSPNSAENRTAIAMIARSDPYGTLPCHDLRQGAILMIGQQNLTH